MTKRRLKKSVIPIFYGVAIMLTVFSIYMIERATNQAYKEPENNDPTYVNKTVFENTKPVVNTSVTMIQPFTDKEVKVVKNFYDYKGEAEKQQDSLLYHDGTYLQSSGVSFGGKENFDVVSVLDGTVITVKEDQLLGNVVEIQHENGMISSYQSLSTVKVKKDDAVKQGQIIGKSGLSNISKELGSHLHFELMKQGELVNPLDYFDKQVSE